MKKLLDAFEMTSGAGMGLLLLNAIGMMWLDVYKHGFSANEVAVIGLVFAAKTTHGVMTSGGDDK